MRSKKNNDPATQGVKLRQLDNLVKRIESAKVHADDARSDIGVIYKEAEDFGFHRKAMKEAIRLKNMEPDKRNDYLSSLQSYCDYFKIWAQGELFGQAPRTPTPPDAEERAPDTPDEQLSSVGKQVGTFNFEQGRVAAHHAKSIDDNPWGKGVKAHATWEAGFKAGTQEIEDGLVEEQKAEASAG